MVIARHIILCMFTVVVVYGTGASDNVCAGDTCGKDEARSTQESQDASGSEIGIQARNDMIPIWHDQLYAAAENRSFADFIRVMNEGSTQSRLVAYQCCRILQVLATYDKAEKGDGTREELVKLGAIEAVTKAMGAHLNSPKVQGMGCVAIQGIADGHADHIARAVDMGAGDVIAWILSRIGSLDASVAEYCIAAVATLSYAPLGRARLGRVGAVEGVVAAMGAHQKVKPEIHVYGCASLVRMCLHDDDSARENQKRLLSIQGAAKTIFEAMKTYGNHPTLLSQCGSLLKGGHGANELPSGSSS